MKSKFILVASLAASIFFASTGIGLAPVVKADTFFFQTEAYAEEVPKSAFGPRALECLALNIYFEARGSNLADKVAVADVVLNRKKDRRYPNTVCGVVEQAKLDSNGHPRRNQCQFSWFCDGRSDTPRDIDRWEEAQLLAHQILVDGKYRGISEGATHYHATYVNPTWARSFQQVGRIGEHVFYRWE
jgi:spore germination cell wall hydrolase CwlJ-like protein